MLDMGFIHALRQIAPLLPKERQTMLFSATMPKLMADLSRDYLNDPVRIQVSPPGRPADKIDQSVHFVAQADKLGLLSKLLAQKGNVRSLVFARTKHGAERLMTQLEKAGFNAGSIHGNKSQGQRDRALKALKTGDIDVLVATDVAARGIDIDGISHVYNFDLPNVAENYVHRIGRTARAGASGSAVAFCSPDESSELKAIQKLLGTELEIAGGTPWEPMRGSRKPGQSQKPGQTQKPRRRVRNRGGKVMKRAA